MNDVLYHKSMALCTLPYEKVRLLNTSADGYLYQVIADTEADWVINIDEDAFISNIDALQRLIGYCMAVRHQQIERESQSSTIHTNRFARWCA